MMVVRPHTPRRSAVCWKKLDVRGSGRMILPSEWQLRRGKVGVIRSMLII